MKPSGVVRLSANQELLNLHLWRTMAVRSQELCHVLVAKGANLVVGEVRSTVLPITDPMTLVIVAGVIDVRVLAVPA
jgi:hypothetical protein|tara:strand:- start:6557 stop:6787 length:231 start_codon:yes stop_codon:yes gene_type:complete